MKNSNVQSDLDSCEAELNHVKTLIDGLGITSLVVPYLSKYAIIRACGCVEQSFKTLIADYCDYRSKKQVKQFLNKRIREGSANPSYQNLLKFLKEFDDDWHTNFKAAINALPDKEILLTSLQSLVDARNDFAHGGSPSVTIGDTLKYFAHSKKVIIFMDTAIV